MCALAPPEELGVDRIRKVAKENKLRIKESTIQTLLSVAKQSIIRSKEEVSAELLLLRLALQDLRRLDENVRVIVKEIEQIRNCPRRTTR
jgi:transposase